MIYIVPGDCLQKMAMLPAASLDAVVTDPPYGLAFMGKDWDHGVPGAPFWQQMLRLLKPGAHLVAFGGSRTYHRLTCAIEDAGFEIRDSLLDLLNPDDPIAKFMDSLNDAQRDAFVRCVDHAAPGGPLAWLYGTGFPKSHDVSKGIDKAVGAEREITREGAKQIGGYGDDWDTNSSDKRERRDIPATPEAAAWEGWGTALKPAFEPIVLARKPLSEGTVAANVLRWGTGALNIGGCRVPTSENLNGGAYSGGSKNLADATSYATGVNAGVFKQPEGRWPANVVHDGSDEVVGAFPNSGPSRARAATPNVGSNWAIGAERSSVPGGATYNDPGGSAARFFYSAKASRADRAGSKHPTVKPIALMQWLCRLVTPPGGTVLDPFAGSGTTGAAAAAEGFNAILMEKEPTYVEDMRRRFP